MIVFQLKTKLTIGLADIGSIWNASQTILKQQNENNQSYPLYYISVSEYGRMNGRLIRVRSTVQIHIGKNAATYGNNTIKGILADPNQHISWGAHLDTGVAPSPNGQQGRLTKRPVDQPIHVSLTKFTTFQYFIIIHFIVVWFRYLMSLCPNKF